MAVSYRPKAAVRRDFAQVLYRTPDIRAHGVHGGVYERVEAGLFWLDYLVVPPYTRRQRPARSRVMLQLQDGIPGHKSELVVAVVILVRKALLRQQDVAQVMVLHGQFAVVFLVPGLACNVMGNLQERKHL